MPRVGKGCRVGMSLFCWHFVFLWTPVTSRRRISLKGWSRLGDEVLVPENQAQAGEGDMVLVTVFTSLLWSCPGRVVSNENLKFCVS